MIAAADAAATRSEPKETTKRVGEKNVITKIDLD